MAEAAKLIGLVRAHRLHALPSASKDDLDVHAAHFARATRDYERAAADAFRAGDLSVSDQAAERYRMALQFYAPGLVAGLARALLDMEAGRG